MPGGFAEAVSTQTRRGILLIVTSAFFYALMSVFVRLSGELPFFQKALFRNGISLAASLLVIARQRPTLAVPRASRLPLVCRVLFGTLGVYCNYYAIDRLPLAAANSLNKLGPFFAVLFAALCLRERVGKKQVLCLAVALAGSLFLILPGLTALNFAVLIAFLGGACAGGIQTSLRALQRQGSLRDSVIVFYFSSFSTLCTLIPSILAWDPMSLRQVLCLLAAGCACAVAQFCLTGAFRYAAPRDISLYDCSQIVFSAVMGFLIFGQTPTPASLIAYVLIIAASALLFLFHRHSDRQGPSGQSGV